MPLLNKIAIIGGGPVGLLLTKFFHSSGSEVYLFDTDKVKINLLKKEGIIIQNQDQKETFLPQYVFSHISDAPRDVQFDAVFFSTKSYQTKRAAIDVFNHLGHQLVVSAQNGIETEEILRDVFGDAFVLRMVINFAGNLIAPNIVKQSFFIPPNYIASIDDSKKNISDKIATQLSEIGIDTKSVDSFHILKYVWEKTILNSSLSALCGITKMTMKEVMSQPEMVEVVEQLIIESVEVAAAEKIFFEDDFIRKCMRYLKKAGDHFPSLAIDMINGKETEIDFFNGKFVHYGRKHYIKTPLNQIFYTIVKGQSMKNILASAKLFNNISQNAISSNHTKHSSAYLGIDLGSSYTKIAVINENNQLVFKTILKTFNRDKISIQHVIETIYNEYNILASCATGYGRKYFAQSDIVKTEINCAARCVNHYLPGEKVILDIGGEDIKVIKCDKQGLVENFYLNDKCAAGTGAFISEIAERAGLDIREMSELAKRSEYNKPLNSFCTVFAKTEIMNWIFEGLPIHDVAKGIYLSIASRVSKMKIDTSCPVVFIGGVSAYHPYFKNILEETLHTKIQTLENAQFIVAMGASMMAKDFYQQSKSQPVKL